MAADAVTTCLQQLTDYTQFERLCSDLMTFEGYPDLEPLGGFKDKGRDAVHVSKTTDRASIFSYSVREDWRKKLVEDATKVRKHGHTCDELVYLTTAAPSAGERDNAKAAVKKTFGFDLEIYSLERLGVLLRTKRRRLIGLHPQIFPPAFFPPVYAGIDPDEQNFVFIDYVEADEVLALWLSRRLLAAGYRPWCRKLSLFAGENASEVMNGVIRNHAARVVAIHSAASLRDPDTLSRRAIARSMATERGATFFLPLAAEALDRAALDSQTRGLAFLRFDRSWAEGIGQLLEALANGECPRPLPNGPEVASQTMLLTGVITATPEPLYSNCFPVTHVPEVVHLYKSEKPFDYDTRRELATRWAFRATSDQRAVSFHRPPPDVAKDLGITKSGGACWADVPSIDEVKSRNIVMELLRKSLLVKCAERGLVRSDETSPLHFPLGLAPKDRITYTRPDGESTWVAAVGTRSVYRRGQSVPYRYHLAPTFFVRDDLGGHPTAVLKVRVHITDMEGGQLPKRTAGSRRKSMFKSWYNYAWLSRTFAIASFLAEDGEHIVIGSHPDERILIRTAPLSWEAPMSIDEQVLGPEDDEEELVPGRFEDEDEDDEGGTGDGDETA